MKWILLIAMLLSGCSDDEPESARVAKTFDAIARLQADFEKPAGDEVFKNHLGTARYLLSTLSASNTATHLKLAADAFEYGHLAPNESELSWATAQGRIELETARRLWEAAGNVVAGPTTAN